MPRSTIRLEFSAKFGFFAIFLHFNSFSEFMAVSEAPKYFALQFLSFPHPTEEKFSSILKNYTKAKKLNLLKISNNFYSIFCSKPCVYFLSPRARFSWMTNFGKNSWGRDSAWSSGHHIHAYAWPI